MRYTRFIMIFLLSAFLPLGIQAQKPDVYQKGSEGQVLLWLNSSAYDYIGVKPYDYDNNVALGANDGSYKTYKTRTIGEYEWLSQNLFIEYANRMGTALAWANFDQNVINQMNQEYQQKSNIPLSDFLQINGSYITLYDTGSSYRSSYKFYTQRNGAQISGWDLPNSTDFFQMFGQAPTISNDPVTNIMNFLGANKADVPADYTADWFEYKNTSGFTMTPLGRRHSSQEGIGAQKWFGYKVESTLRLKDYPKGMILFNRNTGIDISSNLYHFSQARYCRVKTDQELGYKIYVDDCNDQLVMYPITKVTQFTELPKGLERGIALRYANMGEMKILKKWSEIKEEAAQIRKAIPIIPTMAPLPVSPCEEPEVITPDPYQKGEKGEMTLWISSADPNYGIYAYDYDNAKEMGQYDGSWKTYPTINIGEYEVTSKNLLLHYRDKWSVAMWWVTNSQVTINQMNKEYNGKDNVNLEIFNDINGSYVPLNNEASSYRNTFKVYNKSRTTYLAGWDLMSSTDFLQMMGQAPVTNGNDTFKNVMDFLGANKSDVPADYTADWFEYKNTSGFTMTPLGRRHSSSEGVNGQKWMGYKVESGFRLKDYPAGMLLFSRLNGISISGNLYHFCQARYSRPKTDQELGYKMYIDKANDAVVMLPYTQISTLPELPRGAERGVALRYANRKNFKVLKKWSEIKEEAARIKRIITGDLIEIPIEPVEPVDPTDPVIPINPIEPIDPIEPLDPSEEYCENSEDIVEFTYDASGNRIKKEIILTKTRSAEASQPFFDQVDNQKIIIYPNPTRGQLMVEITDQSDILSGTLTVLNLKGQIVAKQTINQKQINLNISNEPSGTYILHININGKISTWKIIKR